MCCGQAPPHAIGPLRRLATFCVHEHDQVMLHSAFRGLTSDEMYFGTGAAVPADLSARAAPARRGCVAANRCFTRNR